MRNVRTFNMKIAPLITLSLLLLMPPSRAADELNTSLAGVDTVSEQVEGRQDRRSSEPTRHRGNRSPVTHDAQFIAQAEDGRASSPMLNHSDSKPRHSSPCGHRAVQHIVHERLGRFRTTTRESQLTLNNRESNRRRLKAELVDLVTIEGQPPAFHVPNAPWHTSAPPEAPRPIRFHPAYAATMLDLEYSQPAKAEFLKAKLVPAMIASLQQYISLRRPVPDGHPLLLPRYCESSWGPAHGNRCQRVQPIRTCLLSEHDPRFFGPYTTCSQPESSSCVKHPGGEGVPNADFVLYVSADEALCKDGMVAFAGACELDPATMRPVAGEINFCPDYILTGPEHWGYMLDTSVHEMMHATAMHTSLYPFFVDSDLKQRGEAVTRKANSHAHSYSQYGMTTPAVVAAFRQHTGCQDVDAMPLENEGGEGTALAHWELRAAMDDIMVGLSAIDGTERAIFSNITLALLEDTGWYSPNWEAAGALKWGRGAGCSMMTGSCLPPDRQQPEEATADDGFCSPTQLELGGTVCSWDLKAVGSCQPSILGDGCAVKMKYSDYVCTDGTSRNPRLQNSLSGLGEAFGASSRCLGESAIVPVQRVLDVAYPGHGDKEDTPQGSMLQHGIIQDKYSKLGAGCYEMMCAPGGQLHISVAGVSLPCPEGEYVDLASSDALRNLGFRQGRLGPCPAADRVCPELGCSAECDKGGQCVHGVCRCHIGRAGPNCDDISLGLLTGHQSYSNEKDSLPVMENDSREYDNTRNDGEFHPGRVFQPEVMVGMQLGQLPLAVSHNDEEAVGPCPESRVTSRTGSNCNPSSVGYRNNTSRGSISSNDGLAARVKKCDEWTDENCQVEHREFKNANMTSKSDVKYSAALSSNGLYHLPEILQQIMVGSIATMLVVLAATV